MYNFPMIFSNIIYNQADWKAVRGALVGCLALIRRKSVVGTVTGSDAKSITQSFLQHLQVQSLGLHDRKVKLFLLSKGNKILCFCCKVELSHFEKTCIQSKNEHLTLLYA
jgi:hypothetical protein